MNDVASSDANIRLGMFEAACDILAAAVIVYDKNDCLVFASRQVLRYFPIHADTLQPGTRLRDVLGAIFDTGVRYGIPRNSATRRSTARSGFPRRSPCIGANNMMRSNG